MRRVNLRHGYSGAPGHRIYDVYVGGRRVCQLVRGWPREGDGWRIFGLGRLPNHGRVGSRGEAKRMIRAKLRGRA